MTKLKAIRVYDKGGNSHDRYTIVADYGSEKHFFGMSNDPYSPLGYNQYYGSSLDPKPPLETNHLGVKISIPSHLLQAITDRIKS